jgi:mono/diheme cytochrome c family protein
VLDRRRGLIGVFATLLLLVTGCGGEAGPTTTRDPGQAVARGERLYTATCETCHAADGGGVRGMAGPMALSDFIANRTDAQMVQFLIDGLPGNHPDNRTGVAMPPRGGNPRLSTDDLYDIIEYLRTLE